MQASLAGKLGPRHEPSIMSFATDEASERAAAAAPVEISAVDLAGMGVAQR
jgi:hypothetical protein